MDLGRIKDTSNKDKLMGQGTKAADGIHRIFNGDGYLKDAELKVMNLKPSGCKSNVAKGKCWEEVTFAQ